MVCGLKQLHINHINGGLSKPSPEHTYTNMDRDFLCDCHLDLEHASALRQLSACTDNKSAHLNFHLAVNMGFY